MYTVICKEHADNGRFVIRHGLTLKLDTFAQALSYAIDKWNAGYSVAINDNDGTTVYTRF